MLTNAKTNEHVLVLYIDELEVGIKYYAPTGTVCRQFGEMEFFFFSFLSSFLF
jgi:hypothetical protein